MHYFLTGHTGFKGSWLLAWLTERGHTVSGLSLNPEPSSLFERAALHRRVYRDYRVDIRDSAATARALDEAQPDVVIHLAAQPLVRESYRLPRETFETNVNGTLNILQAVERAQCVKAQLIVTTDKVYKNTGKATGYVEEDALGGDDPYSASKAMADVLASSWGKSFPGSPMAIARAGNVLGGGDISIDRLLPDLMGAFASGTVARIRFPDAVRPWQHVLDCLNGYLHIVDGLLAGQVEGPWNIGPANGCATVREIVDLAVHAWGEGASFEVDENSHPHEAAFLTLDSTKARELLSWREVIDVQQAVEWTVEWQQKVRHGASSMEVCIDQIRTFEEMMQHQD